MRKSGNKVLIIVLAVITLLAVIGGIFAYIYLATDIFKSGKELFAKYLTQSITEITQTVNIEKISNIEDKLKESKTHIAMRKLSQDLTMIKYDIQQG